MPQVAKNTPLPGLGPKDFPGAVILGPGRDTAFYLSGGMGLEAGLDGI